ncbi:hypothetical protein EJB05_10596, partial [Eragrostis curvula]
MARHAPVLFTVLAVLAVAAASASAYMRAADKDELVIIRGTGFVGDEEDEHGLGRGLISRRRMQDLNDTSNSTDATPPVAADNSTDPTAGYISYGALRADSVPCDVPGASYYNCRTGPEVNPYTRGCSAITMCRS